MTVADHIAIIADGKLVEAATPRQIYGHPRARFTAEFIGENNLLDGRVTECDGAEARVDLGHARVRVPSGGRAVEAGARVSVSIPSERLRLSDGGGDGLERLQARFVERLYLGLTHNDVVRLDDGKDLLVRSLASGAGPDPVPGSRVTVAWERGDARLHTD